MDILKSPAGLAGLVAVGVCVLFLVMLWRGGGTAADRPGAFARFFLVMLRITIGWHFLVEGLDKLHTPNWSSEGYLRESSGPLAPRFRALAGDRMLALLDNDGKSISPALADEWQRYVDFFAAHYEFNDEARTKANAALEKAKAAAISVEVDDSTAKEKKTKKAPGWLVEKKSVAYPGPLPPPIPKDMTVAERIAAYRENLMPEVEKTEAALPELGKDGWPEWRVAKANAAKWRSDLKADLDAATADLTADLNKLISADQKWREPPPYPAPRPFDSSRQLDVADAVVKYGLIVVGIGLIAGCLTRLAAVLGAVLLLSFFLAMPPLPYLPESPKAEGHYLYINKNIIEMFALLSLACLPTGRWAGVDGILQFLNPFRRKETDEAKPEAANKT